MSACNLVLKAPNGKPSKLFKSIADNVLSPEEAIDTYFFTKTDEFKRMYGDYTAEGYSGPKLDENGEPEYATFSKEAYQYDNDFLSVDLSNRAQVYKDLVNRIPQIRKTIQERLGYLKSGAHAQSSTVKNLEALDDLLASGTINDSIPRMIEMAAKHTGHLRKEVEKLLKDPEADIRRFAGIYKVAKTYDIVKDLRLELLGEDFEAVFGEDVVPIGQTLADIHAIESHYISKSKDHLAHEFHKRNPSWSLSEIKKSLDSAPRDLRFDEQMLEYLGDSNDPILSMVGAVMMEAEHKIRREAIDFNKRLQPLVEKLEAKYSGNPYEKLIYQKENGELHIIDIDATDTGGKFKDIDEQYRKLQEIKQDPDLYEFLVFFTSEYETLQKMLGNKGPDMGTRIPTVLKKDWERLQGKSLKERYDMITDDVKKSISRSNLDTERGNLTTGTSPVRNIPVFYTQKYDSLDYDKEYQKKYDELISAGKPEVEAITTAHAYAEREAAKLTASYISQDLGHTLQAFHSMAMNYSAKNELISIFDSAEAVVGSDFRRYTLVDSGGKPIVNKYDGSIETKSGAESTTKKVLTKFLDMHLYDQKEKDLGETKILGTNVSVDNAKVLRKIGKSSGLIQLSTNVLAAMNNIGMGEYSNLLDAVGGENYGVKDLKRATKFYSSNLGGIMADVGARTPSNIVNLLEEHYNILQSYEQDIKSSERSRAKRLLNSGILAFMNNSAEHALQVRVGLAMLNKEKAYDKDGKSLGSLLDLHKVENGRLIVPDVYVKDSRGTLVKFDVNQQNFLSNKIAAVNRSAHGNYSPQTAIAASQDARLALVLQFRKWMYPGLMRRYAKKSYNQMTNMETEGFYRTGARVLPEIVKDLARLKMSLAAEKWEKLTPQEKANTRKFILEASMAITLAAASILLNGAGETDDTEENYANMSFVERMKHGAYLTTVYQVNRMTTELWAYANPVEAIKLMRTPAASLSILESVSEVVIQATSPFEEYETGWRKGDNKFLTKLGKLVPVYKQLDSFVPQALQEKTRYYN